MNTVPSLDFGARDFDGKGEEDHDHLFLGANTGLAAILGNPQVVEAHSKFLSDRKVRVDIFALREGGIDGAFLGPLRPEVPTLEPEKPYLVEVVVRTLGLGHPFSQGTADSNEIWVELIAKAGDRVIGRSGAWTPTGGSTCSHFISVYMLDRNGHRIDRRNPQDIFVPLYNKQIPPGRARSSTSGSTSPRRRRGRSRSRRRSLPEVRSQVSRHHLRQGEGPRIPIVVMARDLVQLPVRGDRRRGTNRPNPRGRHLAVLE